MTQFDAVVVHGSIPFTLPQFVKKDTLKVLRPTLRMTLQHWVQAQHIAAAVGGGGVSEMGQLINPPPR